MFEERTKPSSSLKIDCLVAVMRVVRLKVTVQRAAGRMAPRRLEKGD
jgi:hypothetical protein